VAHALNSLALRLSDFEGYFYMTTHYPTFTVLCRRVVRESTIMQVIAVANVGKGLPVLIGERNASLWSASCGWGPCHPSR